MTAVVSSMAYAYREAGVARGRALFRLNQDGGFDCPSCAWPDPKHRSIVEFCENGARAVADEATTKRVDRHFFQTHSIPELLERSDHWLNDQGRLTEPMVRRPGSSHYEPVSWDEAFELLAVTLNALPTPNGALFYTSGRASNEAAFLYQLFARHFGTNNLPDCSNMCHESSGKGLGETIGIGKGTVTLEDFDEADVIAVIGQNPATNHPRMLAALQSAKKKGATIITINPLEEVGMVRFKHPQHVEGMLGSGTELTDLHLQVRIGGDLALLQGIQRRMLSLEGAVDGDYVARCTEGFTAYREQLLTLDEARLVEDSGISAGQMQQAAELFAGSKATIACWAMGITQHVNGVANVQSIVNLLLMGGHFGRPGAGACPVRGHSNVQGDRTVGIWEFPPKWTSRMERHFDFEAPVEPGHDVVGAIEAMRKGEAKVFFALGGNFLSATPDTTVVAQGLRKMKLTAHVATKLNRAHLVTGDIGLLLPCLGRTERDVQIAGPQFVTVENSMGIVHSSEGKLKPASDALFSEPRIVARMAHATLGDRSQVPWLDFADDYDRIREAIEACIPGFDNYNERVRGRNGFYLPNPVREGGFGTRSGRGLFTTHELPDLSLGTDRFWLMTMRSHDQFNTTVYDLNDRYRGIYGHRHVVLMSPDDVERLGLETRSRVRLRSYFQDEERTVDGFLVVPYDIPSGNVACYFPEANPLIPVGSFAEGSRTPTSKRVEVSIETQN
ncbi:MAG: FdhF/YdeP family oxidoreductase [Myxococcota bacterium]